MSEPSPPPLSRRWRMILSVLILAHLTAVFAPPMAFQSRGPRGLSPSIATLLRPFSSYGQFLYMDRGYAFFAPDPGPSHLMAVEASDPADPTSRSVERFPSLEKQWPRLLYHRHFMLAEFLNDAYQPALPIEAAQFVGPDLPAEELQAWRLGRKRYEAIVASMTAHATSKIADSQDKLVEVKRIEHLIPDFVGFTTRGTPLNDPASYITFDDIPVTLETLLGGRPASLPQPGFAEPMVTEPIATEPIETEPVPAPSGERAESESPEPQSPEPQSPEPQSPEPQSPEPQSPEPQSPATDVQNVDDPEPTSATSEAEASS